MIYLEPISTQQTIKFLADRPKEDFPISNATFEFLDSYSGGVTSTTANITLNGFINEAEITVQLQNERKYQLTVITAGDTIFTDNVFVSDQLETESTDQARVDSTESYSINNGDFIYFNPGDNPDSKVIFNTNG